MVNRGDCGVAPRVGSSHWKVLRREMVSSDGVLTHANHRAENGLREMQ